MTKDGTIFLILTIIALIQLATLIGLSNKIIYFKKHAITYECAKYSATTGNFEWITKDKK